MSNVYLYNQFMEPQPKKILVVEDDVFLSEIYVDTLTKEGYNIDRAIDGEQATQKIKQGGYDLILLDIIMPKMDGISVMENLKQDPSFKLTCPLVFLTNLDNEEQMKKALSLGNGYLIKSLMTPGDLVTEVKQYLSMQFAPLTQTPPTTQQN